MKVKIPEQQSICSPFTLTASLHGKEPQVNLSIVHFSMRSSDSGVHEVYQAPTVQSSGCGGSRVCGYEENRSFFCFQHYYISPTEAALVSPSNLEQRACVHHSLINKLNYVIYGRPNHLKPHEFNRGQAELAATAPGFVIFYFIELIFWMLLNLPTGICMCQNYYDAVASKWTHLGLQEKLSSAARCRHNFY